MSDHVAPPAGPLPGVSLQKQYAEKSICFGCGPANAQGLQLESFVEGDVLVATFTPAPHHHAFPGVLNGGIIGALLDCHSNWAACWHLMVASGLAAPPCTVTADFHVKLKRPTPMQAVRLVAKVARAEADRALIEATLEGANGKITATCAGTFVAVKEDHPAYHRW